MWRPPAPLAHSLSTRRSLTALGLTLGTLLLLGGALVGIAVATDPHSTAVAPPPTLAVPAPHIGDTGHYTIQRMERDSEGKFVEAAPAVPFFSFEWLGDLATHDAQGRPVLAYEANLTRYTHDGEVRNEVVFYASDDAREIGYELDCSGSAGGGGETAVGRLVPTYESREDWARCIAYWPPHDPAFVATPAASCGLINPLQGRITEMGVPLHLASDCYVDSRWSPGCVAFVPEATESIGGHRAVRFASINHGGDLDVAECDQRATAKLYMWYSEDFPYPIQMAMEGWYDDSVLTVIRLAEAGRGATPLKTSHVSADVPPPVLYGPRQPWGIDDEGVEHPFRLSTAYTLARDNPDDAAMREFLAVHPDALTSSAWYDEDTEENGTRVHRTWSFVLQDEDSFFYGRATQTERPVLDRLALESVLPSTPVKETVYTFDFSGSASGPVIDPDWIPDEWPTAASLMARWSAWGGLTLNDVAPNAYGFQMFAGPDSAGINLGAGFERYDSERGTLPAFASPELRQEYRRSLLWFDAAGHTVEAGEASSAFARETAPPASQEQTTSPQFGASALGVTEVRLPLSSASVALGVGGVAAAVGLSYLFWPSLKAALVGPLFSRVARPKALQNAARAEIAALVDEEPGIHVQEIVRRTGRAVGEVQHHLRILSGLGLVTANARPGYTCYFPAGKVDRRLIDALPLLKSDGAKAVLRAVQASPGSTGAALADATGLSRQAVSQHLTRLANAGLVSVTRAGRGLCISATELGQAAIGRTTGSD